MLKLVKCSTMPNNALFYMVDGAIYIRLLSYVAPALSRF